MKEGGNEGLKKKPERSGHWDVGTVFRLSMTWRVRLEGGNLRWTMAVFMWKPKNL